MMKNIKSDIHRNYRAGFSTLIFILNYRIGRYLYLRKSRIKILWIPYAVCLFFSRVLSFFIGCSVPFSCKLGAGITFQHGLYGVFISGMATIGENCTIFHNVTVGSNFGSKKMIAAPDIGDNVLIGAGVLIIGPVRVGNGATIAAGAVVYKDVVEGHIMKPKLD